MNRLVMILATTVMILAGAPVGADEHRGAQSAERMEEAKARLNLSDEQIDQMAPVLEQSMETQRSIMSKYGVDLENRGGGGGKLGPRKAREMKKELDAVRADTRDELDDILTDEQLEEFAQMQEERKAEMRERIRAQR